jgi:dTDP-4-dehydrorhamnose 3,5-epimerase
MLIRKTTINGLLIFEPDVFKDERGYFFEAFNLMKYKEALGDIQFVQDNISFSKQGVIRGLHYQVGAAAQGKLCQVIAGCVLDVAVDIRFGSPTFGKHFSQELSAKNHFQLWIPPGFAHGFSVLSDEAFFSYNCTSWNDKTAERSIRYDDPFLAIDWKVINPVVSSKDAAGKFFKEIDQDFIYSA